MSPHSLVQELLNRTDDHLWAMVTHGLRLRLLRDNVALTRQAYVDFDLEAMFTGQAYADLAPLWLACHQRRFVAAILPSVSSRDGLSGPRSVARWCGKECAITYRT